MKKSIEIRLWSKVKIIKNVYVDDIEELSVIVQTIHKLSLEKISFTLGFHLFSDVKLTKQRPVGKIIKVLKDAGINLDYQLEDDTRRIASIALVISSDTMVNYAIKKLNLEIE